MAFRRTDFFRKLLAIILSLCGGTACHLPVWAAGSVTVGGSFTLTAPDGNNVTDQTYRGKWMLVYFGYTSCPDSCPVALMMMTAALNKLGREADELQAIFITLDPQRDTPGVMGEYTKSVDPRIIGLTGTESEIDTVAHAYGAYYVRHSDGSDAQHYLVDHSTYIYLMNPQGRFVRAFDASASGDAIESAIHDEIARQSQQDNSMKHAAQIK